MIIFNNFLQWKNESVFINALALRSDKWSQSGCWFNLSEQGLTCKKDKKGKKEKKCKKREKGKKGKTCKKDKKGKRVKRQRGLTCQKGKNAKREKMQKG